VTTGNTSLVAAPYGAYRCKGDDRWCVLGVYTQEEWKRFCKLLGRPRWARSGKFATHLGRIRHKVELDGWVEAWTGQRDPHEVMKALQGVGVMAAAVQDVEDQFQHDEQYAARGFLTTLKEPEAGEIATEGIPMRLSETPGKVRGPAPLMGEHTHEVARELLGLSDKEIKALEEEGVLV
jgi:benzylsuccinate CoA-transferase BbsF subunit